MVLRNFNGYTMSALMQLPYCHVLALYEMAEDAERLGMRSILIGSNSGGTDTGSEIVDISNLRFDFKKQFKAFITVEAKERAERHMRGLNV